MKIIISETQKNKLIKKLFREDETNTSPTIGDIGKAAWEKAKEMVKNQGDSLLSPSSVSSSPESQHSGSSSLGKISEKGKQLLENPIFKQKLKEISQAINVDENSIIKLMKHESGLNPTVKNSIGCVGLIQFCPSSGAVKTINGKQYTLEDLRNNLEVQMEAIKQFWLSGYKRGKIKNAADLYIYNFFPVAAGKSNDYVLQTKGLSAQTIAKANPVFNKVLGRDVSTPLTVGDLNQYYRKTGMV